MSYSFLENLKKERTTYKDMIDFCCDSLVLNNCIIGELGAYGIEFEVYCGSDREYTNAEGDYISEEEFYKLQEEDKEGDIIYDDIYQYFIINYEDAGRLVEYTNELVLYNEQLDLYLLAIKHCGTSWGYVPANWKELDEVSEDD